MDAAIRHSTETGALIYDFIMAESIRDLPRYDIGNTGNSMLPLDVERDDHWGMWIRVSDVDGLTEEPTNLPEVP
jgi:hypothetical protein